jgi:hypothetical protein
MVLGTVEARYGEVYLCSCDLSMKNGEKTVSSRFFSSVQLVRSR